MFQVGANWLFALPKERVRSDLRWLKIRLQKLVLETFKVGPNSVFPLLKEQVRSDLR